MTTGNQFGRRISLLLSSVDKVLDLSEFRIKFNVQAADVQIPNAAEIRVYNLSAGTVRQIQAKGEFSEVTLSAGYSDGNFGVIFSGTIKQYKIGRENATDSYLDIFASDGDELYNQGFVNLSQAKGKTPADLIKALAKNDGVTADLTSVKTDAQHVPSIRGVVQFGMSRLKYRNLASQLDAGWSIQNGAIQFTDNTGYREDEAVAINVLTGLIGVPELTDEGISIQCLLNSRVRIGSRVQLNNKEVAQLVERDPTSAPLYYNVRASSIRNSGFLSADGMYRAFAITHDGDSRGNAWYTHLVCLNVDISAVPDQSVSK